MDVTEPPRIVWESPGACGTSAHSEDLLRQAVASARAPGLAWVVRIRVEPTSDHTLRAEGQITDEGGAVIARRLLSGAPGDCDGLARAVGVWASLVLDAQRSHAGSPESAKTRSGPAGSTASDGSSGATGSTAMEVALTDPPSAFGAADSHPETTWPAPAVLEKPSPEHDWYLHHDDERTLEVGVGAFLMTGTSTNTMAGASPYVVVEAGNGVFLRPSLAVAQSVAPLASAGEIRATWGAARFDTCLRLPGLYTRHRGIQLDTCGGADIGLTHLGDAPQGSTGTPVNVVTMPFASVGPSLELRGELGGKLSVAIRGVAGLNIARPAFDDGTGVRVETPVWSGRIEVALSWRLQ